MDCGCSPRKLDTSCPKEDACTTRAVLETKTPEEMILFRKVVVPASIGTDTDNPPQNGAYKNVLLYYEANGASYLYSSDGIPTKLVNGTTDYTYTTNKPSINSVTLEGNKSSAELGLADSTLVIDIDPDNNTWSYDGTLQDIYDAFLAGRYVVLDASGSAPSAIPVVTMFYSPSIQDKLFVTIDYSATMSIGGQIDFADECGRAKIVLYPDNTMSINSQAFQNALTAGDGISIDSHYVIKAKAGDGLEIDSIGNIDIANLEQYAHFFDTVADMKAATNLSDGDYAKTGGFYSRNDGGSALYKVRTVTDSDTVDEMFIIAIGENDLVAELITEDLVNICQVGGQQNFATTFNYIANLGKNIYIPKGNYSVSGTLLINHDSTKLICDGNLTLSENYSGPLFRITSKRNIIKINGELTAVGNNAIELCGGQQVNSFNNNIYIHFIANSLNGVVINPNGTKGFQTSKIDFDRIIASNIGIYINPGDTGDPWVTSTTFNGGQITAPYSIKLKKGANQTSVFNQLVFNDIVCDGGVECGFDLEQGQNVFVNNIRLVEELVGSKIIKLDSCKFCHIKCEGYISLGRIQLTNNYKEAPNTLIANGISDSDSYTIGLKAWTYYDKFVLDSTISRMSFLPYITTTSNTNLSEPEYYFNDIIIQINNTDADQTLQYDLPEIFGQCGVTKFYIYVVNKESTSSIRIRDNAHNNILNLGTGSSLSYKRYKCELVKYITGGPVWIVQALN